MPLTPAQIQNPHRTCTSRVLRMSVSYLERSFAESLRGDERAAWWDNGTASAALAHPVRGPRLLRAFLAGVARRATPLTEDEANTWGKLWRESKHRPHRTTALAFTVLSMRSPQQAMDLMLQENISLHTPLDESFPLLTNHGAGLHPPTAWTAALSQARRLISRARSQYPDEGSIDERIEALLWQLEAGWNEDGWTTRERHHALALLTTVGAEHRLLDHPIFLAWHQRLIAAGASPWMSGDPGQDNSETPNQGSALSSWMEALRSHPTNNAMETWGHLMLHVPPPPGTHLASNAWTALAALKSPAKAIDILVENGLSPFSNDGQLWTSNRYLPPLFPNMDWASWGDAMDALHRSGRVPSPNSAWLIQAVSSWHSRWQREAPSIEIMNNNGAPLQDVMRAWEDGWTFLGKTLGNHILNLPKIELDRTIAVKLASFSFWEHTPELMVAAGNALARQGVLAHLLTANTTLFHHALVEPTFSALLDECFQTENGNDLKKRLWISLAKGWCATDLNRVEDRVRLIDSWSQGIEPSYLIDALRVSLRSHSSHSPWLSSHLLALGARPHEGMVADGHYNVLEAWRQGHEYMEGTGIPLAELVKDGWDTRQAGPQGTSVFGHYILTNKLNARTQAHVDFLVREGLADSQELMALDHSMFMDPGMAQYATRKTNAHLIEQALAQQPARASQRARL